MAPRKPIPPQISAARMLLQNPYAFIEYLEDDEDQPVVSVRAQEDRGSQNPYASLSSGTDDEDVGDLKDAVVPVERIGGKVRAHPMRGRSMSKEEFRRTATRILGQYIPALERGRLRAHHKSFIERNENRPAEVRGRLIQELGRYDLSTVVGIKPHFNREPLDLTEEKLRRVEATVLDPD